MILKSYIKITLRGLVSMSNVKISPILRSSFKKCYFAVTRPELLTVSRYVDIFDNIICWTDDKKSWKKTNALGNLVLDGIQTHSCVGSVITSQKQKKNN